MNGTRHAEEGGRTYGGEPYGLDPETPVLVMRTDANVFHHGTLAAVRSLGRAGIEVHAILEGRHAPASRSRYLAGMHTWQHDTSPEALIPALTAIAERIGRRAVLVPMDDLGAITVAEHATALSGSFLLPAQRPALPRGLADKARLARLCATLEVAQPETRVIAGGTDMEAALRDLGLPLVAKWARPWLLRGGRPTTVVHRREQAERLLGRVGDGSELLFQRYVPDTPGSDWFFHGYFDENSAPLFKGTGRKERAYPTGSGLTTFGRWLPNPRVEALAVDLAMDLGYRGVLDLDFRYDAAADVYHLLDFNPRLGAQFRLFRDDAGLDLVRVLHLHLTGRPAAGAKAAYGRTYLVENYDTFPALRERRTGRITSRQWWRSVRDADELAWFSADDPAPFLAMSRQTLKRAFTRLADRR